MYRNLCNYRIRTIRCCIAEIMGVENPLKFVSVRPYIGLTYAKGYAEMRKNGKYRPRWGKMGMADGSREKAVSIETDKDKIFYR